MQSLSLEAKDEPPLLLPAPVNELTEIPTLTICHRDGTDVSFVTSDRSVVNHVAYAFFFVSEQVVVAADGSRYRLSSITLGLATTRLGHDLWARDFCGTSGINKGSICKHVGGSVWLHKGSEHTAANSCPHADQIESKSNMYFQTI